MEITAPDHPMRRNSDDPAAPTPPTKVLKATVNDRRDITIIFLGVLIAVCMLEIILAILALASLRSIGIWTSLDPHSYAGITVSVAVVGFVATVCYIVYFIKNDGDD